jgi:primosomal protein N' (replication factor Y)
MDEERVRRTRLGFPPAVTTALVGGPAAPELIERLGSPLGLEVRTIDDQWLLVSEDRATLLDTLAAVERPPGRLRLQIDPMRLS